MPYHDAPLVQVRRAAGRKGRGLRISTCPRCGCLQSHGIEFRSPHRTSCPTCGLGYWLKSTSTDPVVVDVLDFPAREVVQVEWPDDYD